MSEPEPAPPNQNQPPQAGEQSGKAPERKKGWIENLAQRSTGLPGDTSGEKSKTAPKGDKSPWSYAGLGLQTAGTIALFTFFGFKLDQKMGWTPWGMVALSMFAVAGTLYLLIKELNQNDKKK